MHLCARPSTYHLHRTRDCHQKKRASGPRGPKLIHARSSNEPTAPQWSPSARIRKLLSYLTLLVEGAGNWSAHPTWSEAKAEDAQRISASRVADQADRISWFFEGGICFFRAGYFNSTTATVTGSSLLSSTILSSFKLPIPVFAMK